MPSKRLLALPCPTCDVKLTLIVDDKSEPLMLQNWKCPVCQGQHEALFTPKIKQVARPIEYPREP